MANSYYDDGMHFIEEGDLVNALVCFSYGHAWLDAGVKLGIFKVSDEKPVYDLNRGIINVKLYCYTRSRLACEKCRKR